MHYLSSLTRIHTKSRDRLTLCLYEIVFLLLVVYFFCAQFLYIYCLLISSRGQEGIQETRNHYQLVGQRGFGGCKHQRREGVREKYHGR